MSMFGTKYPNNIRTVSGTPALKNDDVVLECDTSAGPVIINLLEIPANYWSTIWRLYVIDKSNNASVNNITINAGAGQKVNTLASLVINVNGGGAIIRIFNNTNFGATLNYNAGGGGGCVVCGHTIENGGVAVVQRPNLNFIGPGVGVVDNAGANSTDVTIPGGGAGVIPSYVQAAVIRDGDLSVLSGHDIVFTGIGQVNGFTLVPFGGVANTGLKASRVGRYEFNLLVTGQPGAPGPVLPKGRAYGIFVNGVQVPGEKFTNADFPSTVDTWFGKVVGNGIIQLAPDDIVTVRNISLSEDIIHCNCDGIAATAGCSIYINRIDNN